MTSALLIFGSGTVVYASAPAADTISGATDQGIRPEGVEAHSDSDTASGGIKASERIKAPGDSNTAAEGSKVRSRRPKREKVAEPENAIGKDAAKEKALADAGLTSDQTGKVRSRVSKLEDGTVIYKVRFTYDGQKYSYRIDAVTGEILEKSNEAATENVAATAV